MKRLFTHGRLGNVIVPGDADDAETDHHYSGNGTAFERDIECRGQSFVRCLRGTDIRTNRHHHADVPCESGTHRTDDEADRRPHAEEKQQYGDHHADHRNRDVLPSQKSGRAFTHSIRNRQHTFTTLILLDYPRCGQQCIGDTESTACQSKKNDITHTDPPFLVSRKDFPVLRKIVSRPSTSLLSFDFVTAKFLFDFDIPSGRSGKNHRGCPVQHVRHFRERRVREEEKYDHKVRKVYQIRQES